MNEKPTDDELLQEAIAQYEAEAMDDPRMTPSSPELKESQFKLIRDIFESKDTTKVGNLTSDELGNTNFSVRGLKKIALVADSIGMGPLAVLYRQESEVLTSTSMSRYVKGTNFLNLIFTQIKKSISGTMSSGQPMKKGMFGWGKRGGNSGE